MNTDIELIVIYQPNYYFLSVPRTSKWQGTRLSLSCRLQKLPQSDIGAS